MSKKIRTFIAIEISAEARGRAGRLIKQLERSEAKTSWTRPENLHLTLKFLGDVLDPALPDVCRAVERAVRGVAPFRVTFRQAGAFPRVQQPRTVWIGVEEGLAELRAVQSELEDQLYEAGFPRERRQYLPHLTIGRVREGGPAQQALGDMLSAQSEFNGGASLVDEVTVFASFLDPTGPTHQVVGHYELGE